MEESSKLINPLALRRTKPTHPAVSDILEGLSAQNAVPAELMPAIAEVLTYLHQMDDAAEKRKQIQRR